MPSSERESMAAADKIFISHASADRKLADLLRDTLVLGGIPRNRIFYSSSRATGIPSGTDVRAQLRSELQQAGLIIELISITFLTRPMCLLELGGAWALEKPTYPIVVPPLTRSQAVAQIGDVNMGQLGSHEDIDDVFDELHDRLASDVGVSTTATEWNPFVVLIVVYMLPTLIGLFRGVEALTLVFLINLIGAPVMNGWPAAMILAFGPKRLPAQRARPPRPGALYGPG